MMYCNSKLLQIFYDYSGLSKNDLINDDDYKESLAYLREAIKLAYFDFYDYYILYNTEIGKSYDLLFLKANFKKIKTYWTVIDYESTFVFELEIILNTMASINIDNKNTKEFNDDLKNLIFFKNNSFQRANTNFIKLLYYFNSNYQFTFKDVFNKIKEGVYQSYKDYIHFEIIYYILIEIIGLLFFVIFFAIVNYYLYYSNEILIKNILFLFLDYTDEEINNKNVNHIIKLKLLEFKHLIEDFNLNYFENYLHQNMDISNVNNNNETMINNSSKIKIKQNSILSNQKNSKKCLYSLNDNSSKDDLIKYNLNSQSNKIELNKNSINSISISLEKYKDITNHNNIPKKYNKIKEKGNFKDIILNKSNKVIISLIQRYFIIMLILFFFIIILSIIKIQYEISYKEKFNNFFFDFDSITNRYSSLYYYFNILRTLLILPDDDRKIILENVLENMNANLDKQDKEFLYVVSKNMKPYKKTLKFLNILKLNKNNVLDILKEKICEEDIPCLKYLESKPNIFESGFNLAYQTCIKSIENLFMIYKYIKNKTDINEINSTIINSQNSEFKIISLSLSNMVLYTKEKLFNFLDEDVYNFNDSYNKILKFLNIISIIFGIITFLFVIIIIFIHIAKYINSIKNSVYHISNSLYYIKNYRV